MTLFRRASLEGSWYHRRWRGADSSFNKYRKQEKIQKLGQIPVVSKAVIAKLLLSLIAVTIPAIYLLSDLANDGQSRIRGGAADVPREAAPERQRRRTHAKNASAIHFESPAHKKPLPFRATASKNCVSRREIEDLSGAVRWMLRGGVRVFPRNGFLLGIVRHGGFLPHEGVDVDLGFAYEDLEGLPRDGDAVRAGGFSFELDASPPKCVNWRGVDPIARKPYRFYHATARGRGADGLSMSAFYEYGGTGGHFYPWCSLKYFNHEASLADAIRYNKEGGDIRIVDTDEKLDDSNYQKEAQLGYVFDTDLTCYVEKQFYFTTIPVPCDHEKILNSQFGKNWNHIESRGSIGAFSWMKPFLQIRPVSEEDNDALLSSGPKPICMD